MASSMPALDAQLLIGIDVLLLLSLDEQAVQEEQSFTLGAFPCYLSHGPERQEMCVPGCTS